MATASDDFNRADENPLSGGGNWTTCTALAPRVVSNVVKRSTAGVVMSMWTSPAFTTTQYAQCTLLAPGPSDWPGPAVYCATTANGQGYTLFINTGDNTIHLAKMTAGTAASIASASCTWVDGDVFKLIAIPTGSNVTLAAMQNGRAVLTYGDTTSPLTSGQPGLWYERDNVGGPSIDNWSAADIDFGQGYMGLATNNPYTLPAPMAALYGTWRTSATGLRAVQAGNGYATAYHDANYGASITAEVCHRVAGTGDFTAAMVVARSGANAGKGYAAMQDGTNINLYPLTTDGVWASGALFTTTGGSITAGDVIKITYDRSTGTLSAYKNGTYACGGTDNTLLNDTSLAAGMGYDWAGTGSAYIGYFTGSGVTSSVSTAAFSTIVNQRETSVTMQTYATSTTG